MMELSENKGRQSDLVMLETCPEYVEGWRYRASRKSPPFTGIFTQEYLNLLRSCTGSETASDGVEPRAPLISRVAVNYR
jgi:hypothetical protein